MGMREYETIFITRSELSDDIVDRVSAKVEKAIDELSGVLLVKENWGRKKLAYDIQKQAKGCFLFYHYLGQGNLVSEIERLLKIDEMVLRYMTVKLDENVDPEARKKSINERPVVERQLDDEDTPLGGRSRGILDDGFDPDLDDLDDDDYA